jgi:signal transduction histidine kinase
MLAALRGGTKAVSVAGMGVAFAADWVTVTGRSNDLIAASTSSHQLLYIQAFLAVTLVAAFLLAVDAADRQQAESQARVAESERNRAELAVSAAAGEERRRITRDTHDIVGHALNVMLLQAGAARRMLATDPEVSEELLVSMESIGREAFQDLDVALSLGESPDTTLNRGLDDVPKLVEEMRQSGLDVTMSVAGDPDSCRLSKLVDWSAYRIVEEAMTNIAKHAPGSRSEVSILYQPESVLLAVLDDGPSSRPPNGQHVGRGLVGIRERASAVGARIEVGPRSPRGFAVRVWLPAASSP